MKASTKLVSKGIFLLAAAAILIVFLTSIIKEKKQQNPAKWLKVSVVDIAMKIPPEMVIEVENSGPRTVGLSHFRLQLLIDNKSRCMVSEDIGNFRPGEKKIISLKCSEFRPGVSFPYQIQIDYILQVFPEMKKPIKLEGSFYVEK
jgi:hypothetical protein